MSGFALMIGAGGSRYTFGQMLHAVAERGGPAETLLRDGLLAGTHPLRVEGRDGPVQPCASSDGEWLLCLDGHLFNAGDVRAELVALGRPVRDDSDAELTLAAFRLWGDDAVPRLRGEYAFAIVHRPTGGTYLARDPLGVKPLYWSTMDGRLHVASEVKGLVPVGSRIHEVPPGQHGWAQPPGTPELRPYVDLSTPSGTGIIHRQATRAAAQPEPGGGQRVPAGGAREPAGALREAVRAAVACRVAAGLPVGVLLGGDLGSAVTLLAVREQRPDCVAFALGTPDSGQREFAAALGVSLEVVEVRPRDIGYEQIRAAVRIGELTDYHDIAEMVLTLPLLARVRERGVRVLLTGDGAAELFGGYPHDSRELFLHRVANLYRTALQRLDRASAAHGVSARAPLLDPAVVRLALQAAPGRSGLLGHAFRDQLNGYPAQPARPEASQLHERIRLFRPLVARLHRGFGYDLLAPVQRDFEEVLGGCGNDLAQAVAQRASRPDYTLAEHARDLADAVKVHTKPLLDKLTGPVRRS